MKVLVIAPHPDDEVLGVGGTIHKLTTQGDEVVVAIVTKGWQPLYPADQVAQVRAEAEQANRHLGVTDLRFMDLLVTRLGAMAEHELNAHFDRLVQDTMPDKVFLPFPGDRHDDHRQVFDAAMVALRPVGGRRSVQRIYCYETLSETHWSAPGIEPVFAPQMYVDITDHLQAKCDALRLYASQVMPPPQPRSIEAVESLARWRGSTVGLHAAEAFVIIRELFAD